METVKTFIFLSCLSCLSCLCACNKTADTYDSISGVYPHLAHYNDEGECGHGAVAPWGGYLWTITYGPHLPFGSSDKLYRITPTMEQDVMPESVGGTSANRMIHPESRQLFIGPYAIDTLGRIRTIPYTSMPGRHTGNARHLTDPAGKIYYATMEEGFYEVDVKTLDVKMLYKDGNVDQSKENDTDGNHVNGLLPGAHGKGAYSGQGVMVYSNNGEQGEKALKQFDVEAGSLSEWNGREWTLIRRNQFVEVTGPGGICGNPNPETDPIWATGWDHKSVLLGVREAEKGWHFYRLPKASHSYDGAHGWNTEWPRIRDVGTADRPDFLMTMHGLFWRFPATFASGNSAGIRPRTAYLKVIGDFARWNDRLVFGCDDSAQKEFLNKRKAKGSIEGPGQSNSNLWFTALSLPDELGPATAEGAVWKSESVDAGEASEPFLFDGWEIRTCWIENRGAQSVAFTFETDVAGNDRWQALRLVAVPAAGSVNIAFLPEEKGEWIRVRTDGRTVATVSFNYASPDRRPASPDAIFAGLTPVESSRTLGGLLYGPGDNRRTLGGLLYGLGDNRRALGLLASATDGNGEAAETGYYEMTDRLTLTRTDDPETAGFIRSRFAIPQQAVSIDDASALIVDDLGRRWRLPLGNDAFTPLTNRGYLRVCREVATERDLFNCLGTFYELPAENADGYAKIRPIASHNYRIHDYASYRGMLVLTGVTPDEGRDNPHIVVSDDRKAALWVGVIDDLWRLGKPVGRGGPWKNTTVKAGEKSDPYLCGFYDKKTVSLSHRTNGAVLFTIEADPTGNGDWMEYAACSVQPGETWRHTFPDTFQARWIRFASATDAVVTAWLEYE